MCTSVVSQKGWIVIPKHMRDKYGLREGSRVRVVDQGGGLSIVVVPDDPVAALHGMLAGGSSLTEDLLAGRARDRVLEAGRGSPGVRAG